MSRLNQDFFFEKSSIFLQKIDLVEISSKTGSFVEILILGHPIPYLLWGKLDFSDHFLDPILTLRNYNRIW